MTTAAGGATHCPFCRRPFQPDDVLALSVDTESTAPDGTEYVTFTDYVSRKCSEPDLTVRRATWKPRVLTQ